MRRTLPILALAALAACDAPTDPQRGPTELSTDDVAAVADLYELHVSQSRTEDRPYGGTAIEPGSYWVRLHRVDRSWRRSNQPHLRSGVDSVVFVVDGERHRERRYPFEVKTPEWTDGTYTIDWTVYGNASASGREDVIVGDGGTSKQDSTSAPSDSTAAPSDSTEVPTDTLPDSPEEPADTTPYQPDVETNEAPSASFTVSCAELSCAVDGSGSSDADGTIASYGWAWGDGSTGGGATASHTYGSAGSYTIRLTVTDEDGAQDEATRSVTVEAPAPEPAPEPGSWDVAVSPGQSIQAAVDGNPSGTVFLIRTGTHRGQQVSPKTGQAFVGEPGAVLDGEGASYAFASGADDVRVEGLEIHSYIPPSKDQGAVQSNGSDGWIVKDNVIHDIQGSAVRGGSGTTNMTIVGNVLHTNDNLGISAFATQGFVIENNEIYGNGFSPRTGPGEAAGLKMVAVRNVVVRDNHVHDNDGRGIWLDTDVFDALVEDNLTEDNAKEGIWLEIVCDGGIIRRNTARRNGFGGDPQWWPDLAGIQVVNGVNVEVYENVVEGNVNGIAVIGAEGYPTHACEPHMRNVTVRDNYVQQAKHAEFAAAAGAVDNFGDVDYGTIRFENNSYALGSGVDFRWVDRSLSYSQWQAEGNQ